MPKKLKEIINRSFRKTIKDRRTRRTKRVKKQYGGVDSEKSTPHPNLTNLILL